MGSGGWGVWGGGGGGGGEWPYCNHHICIIIQDYKTLVDNKDQDDMVTMSMFGGKGFNWEFVKRKRINQK